MSIQALNWAFRSSVDDPSSRLILIALANRAREDTGECWPSLRLIMDDTRLSESTVRRKIAELEEAGLIRLEKRFDASGRQMANTIFLVMGGGCHRDTPGSQEGGEGVTVTGGRVSLLTPPNEPKEGTQREKIYSGGGSQEAETPRQIEAWCRQWLVVQGAEKGEIDDWFRVRKKKGGVITRTAIMAILPEAEKAGIDVKQAVRICAERNWLGFRAAWLERDGGTGPPRHDKPPDMRQALRNHLASLNPDAASPGKPESPRPPVELLAYASG